MTNTNDMNTPTKVPCGGFVLGEGLALGEDGKTLNVSGGGSQADWNQNDATAKDYIKNRPGGYEEGFEITWDGDTTGRVKATTEGGAGMPGVWYKVSDTILMPDQIIGSTITLVQNGATEQLDVLYEVISEKEFGYALIDSTVLIAMKQGTFNMNRANISIPETGIYFISVGDTVYISSLSNITVHPFDDKYIPNTIARKDEIYTNYNHTMSITWDGNKDGKDTFAWNTFNYYKISDDVPVFKRIQSVSTSNSIDDTKFTALYEGENCYRTGLSIVVTKAGACQLAIDEGSAMQPFTAPSTGIYFWSNKTGAYQTSLELTSFIEQDGIIVNSANKKWKIAVDDSGTISATEIPE